MKKVVAREERKKAEEKLRKLKEILENDKTDADDIERLLEEKKNLTDKELDKFIHDLQRAITVRKKAETDQKAKETAVNAVVTKARQEHGEEVTEGVSDALARGVDKAAVAAAEKAKLRKKLEGQGLSEALLAATVDGVVDGAMQKFTPADIKQLTAAAVNKHVAALNRLGATEDIQQAAIDQLGKGADRDVVAGSMQAALMGLMARQGNVPQEFRQRVAEQAAGQFVDHTSRHDIEREQAKDERGETQADKKLAKGLGDDWIARMQARLLEMQANGANGAQMANFQRGLQQQGLQRLIANGVDRDQAAAMAGGIPGFMHQDIQRQMLMIQARPGFENTDAAFRANMLHDELIGNADQLQIDAARKRQPKALPKGPLGHRGMRAVGVGEDAAPPLADLGNRRDEAALSAFNELHGAVTALTAQLAASAADWNQAAVAARAARRDAQQLLRN